ncbi:ATP-binding response regulator [Azohydromonas aeria]|uniref:ATP-binding response regulator n=1 Tax=Azohydromonas aeria TaxID=2590212 RepID=UPI0018E022E0|nr:ATP-binding protein [Azohydromonas aeria]
MTQDNRQDRNAEILRLSRQDHELMALVHHDQIESIAVRVRSGAIGALFFSIVMAAYLHRQLGVAVLAWLGVKALVTLWRLALVFQWKNRKARRPAPEKWVAWVRLTLFLDGLVLGSIVLLALHAGAPEETLLWTAAVLCGITAVAMHTLESDWIAGLLYGGPIVAQTGLYLMLLGSGFGHSTALGVAIFGSVLLLNARQAAKDEEQRIIQSRAIRKYQNQNEIALEMARNESRMRADLMSSITHELRTPIHGILAMSHQIAKDPSNPSNAKAAAMIVKSGEHLVGLVNDVLDFGRLEAAGVELRPEVFDLHDLVEELGSIGSMIGREKGVGFDVKNALPAPCHVHADPGRLRQVALNLISNGIKFTPRGGRVTLRVEDDDGKGHMVLQVTDTGEGIAAENLATIFEPFSRHARHPDGAGLGSTGLGLSISRRLASAMKGSLEVASEIGVGSTFTLKVRLEKVVVSLHPKGGEQKAALPVLLQGHALVAEDDPMTAELTRSTLEMHGMAVSVVGQGDMALYQATLQRQRPDIVLMDSDMPGLDGTTAVRKIREFEARMNLPRLPVVVVSGRCGTDDVELAHQAGADAHLCKPYTGTDLVRVVLAQLQSGDGARRGRFS